MITLSDGTLPIPADKLLVHVMVDAGTGELYGPNLNKLSASMRAAGHQPEDITDILVTHIHTDHTGGLMDGSRMVFPNATLHIARKEVDYWLSPEQRARAAESSKKYFDDGPEGLSLGCGRIASDTTNYTAEDMAGKGAASGGSRWNHAGEHVTYAATSISLAAWETRAHFAKGMRLPWNRILVRLDVPDAVWAARVVTPRSLPVGWNVVPEGMISRSIGSAWLAGAASALPVVPSVIINEEDHVLINPAHPDAALITTARVRQFVYDPRV